MADVDLDEDVAGPDATTHRGPFRRTVWIAAAAVGVLLAVVAMIAGGGRSSSSPLPLKGASGAPLEPGRYVLPIAGGEAHPMLPVISVPDGFAVWDEFAALSGDPDVTGRVVWAWDIAGVWSHPCDAGTRLEIVGPTVRDLADALASQPMRGGTEPVPVEVGGYDGLYVELSVPEGVEVTGCAGGRFDSWAEEGGGGGRWQQGPGQNDMLWILDVDGDRVTIAAAHGPEATERAVEELRDMVTTPSFIPADPV